MKNPIFIFLVTLFSLTVTWAQEKLIIIGGGARPPAALKQFGDWCHQEKGRILIVTWASQIPVEVADALVSEFAEQFRGQIEISFHPPSTPQEQDTFLRQLARADGVFFSGGDQSRIMATFQQPRGQILREALEKAYQAGKVFGGTSAGTAIMSRKMIMGNAKNGIVPMAEGLGFLPEHIIVDQHFSQRDRTGRLLQAHQQAKTQIAIGIDEDTALIIQDKSVSRVVGEHRVRAFKGHPNEYKEVAFHAGDNWTLPTPRVRCGPAHR